MPKYEQGKVFNFFLVSYHSKSYPFHLLTFTTASPFNSGYTESRGARQTLGRRGCCIYICRNSALATCNPDEKQLSAAPRGHSPLRVLMCEEKATSIAQTIIQQPFPITAWAVTHQSLPFLRGIQRQFPGVALTRFHLQEAAGAAAAAAR